MDLKQKIKKIDLEFDDLFYERIEKFISLLLQWSKVHNLTGAKSKTEIEANIVDSIYPLKFINDFGSLADIGTGAGYPGMILAIARPQSKAVLIEPRAKRVAFLNFVKSSLNLENVEIIHKRAEEVKPNSYDLITSRAVTNTALLMDITKHLASGNTEYLFYKGSLVDEEIKDARIKNYEIVNIGDRNYLYFRR